MNIFAPLVLCGVLYAAIQAIRIMSRAFARSRYQHAQEMLRTCSGFMEREHWLICAAFWRKQLHAKDTRFHVIVERWGR